MGFKVVVDDITKEEEETVYEFDVDPVYVNSIEVFSSNGSERLPVNLNQDQVKIRLLFKAPSDLEVVNQKMAEQRAKLEEDMYGERPSVTPATGPDTPEMFTVGSGTEETNE